MASGDVVQLSTGFEKETSNSSPCCETGAGAAAIGTQMSRLRPNFQTLRTDCYSPRDLRPDRKTLGIPDTPDTNWVSSLKAGPPPLEAILVIFGRRALIFFLFESSWKKMKNDTTFVRMRSGDHLEDAKTSKKGTSLRRI